MFPLKGEMALWLAPVFGFAFGWLLERGRVTSYDVIVNQFRLRDFRVAKIMLTAIVVGGVGVLVLTQLGFAKWAVRDANLLAAAAGGALFGIGMVLYGYCPGTGLAAIGTGSLHALVGAGGMIVGAMGYAAAYDWIRANVIPVGQLGRVTLADVTGIPLAVLYALLAVASLLFFAWLERRARRIA